ncbi:MAG: MtrAB system histidine kinase MtrB [Actinomycetota bacterium]|nr:MtrAB system histidine kinase MtrB [Actinomycetota bacterium]
MGSWRRSLQLRVVATTLLISGTVVLLLGFVLLDQVTRGLLHAKEQAALAEANSGLAYAQNQLSTTEGTGVPSTSQVLDDLTFSLASRGSRAGLYDVVILSASSSSSGRASGDVDLDSIPPRLSKAVRGGEQAYQYTSLRRTLRHEPGLAVGAPLITNTGAYELYYLFPLTPEAATLALVQRTLAFAGAVLVVLLAGIAGLVTRQVVTPVRMAGRIAERLAAGRLEERMAVRGEDDLATLAKTFNRMADVLQRQIGQLEELSRLQRRFVSDVSHELRTPLTTVRMATDVLHAARADFSPEVARSAELLQTELDRFEQLLGDLLEISRYDAKAAVLEPEPVDLSVVVRRVADAVAALAARRGSDLVLRLPTDPVVADVDPRRVERILRNLLVNAVEHGEGLPVEVLLAGDDEAVAIAVRDHGVGLRPGESALVFNRFWRADPSRARQTGGTGLGLAIALEDARLHGGWLQAWGEIGRGSQFRLTLTRRAGGQLSSSPLPLEPADAPLLTGGRVHG